MSRHLAMVNPFVQELEELAVANVVVKNDAIIEVPWHAFAAQSA